MTDGPEDDESALVELKVTTMSGDIRLLRAP
jgi:hypothetical protein